MYVLWKLARFNFAPLVRAYTHVIDAKVYDLRRCFILNFTLARTDWIINRAQPMQVTTVHLLVLSVSFTEYFQDFACVYARVKRAI